MVAASPRVSNRIAEDFPEPERFDPSRYLDARQEDLQNRWTWIPFGAGKHRCVGNAFAMMQMKAIFSVILRDYEFEMVQPSEDYRDDASKMVIQLEQPCRVKYRRREPDVSWRVVADLGLCQGTPDVPAGEAPDVFGFDDDTDQVVVLQEHPDERLRPQVESAVKYCPAMALAIEEEQ